MYHLTFNLTLTLLFSCHRGIKNMSKITRVLFVFHYNNIPTRKAFIMSYISNRFCNIFNTFTSYCKENISMFKVFRTRNIFFFCMRNTLTKPCIVCSVYFPISDTRDTFFSYLVSFYSCTPINRSGNFFKLYHRYISFRF